MTRRQRADIAPPRPARIARAGPASGRRRAPLWAKVGLLALATLVAIGGREGWDPLGAGDWLATFDIRQPLRAAIYVSPGRADCGVVRVIDGDTIEVTCPGEGILRARLLGFDTPEVFSPGCAAELSLGTRAARALETRIRSSGETRIEFRGSDRYGRRLARLSLDGRDVAAAMIAQGLARPYDGDRRRSWCD